MKSKSYQYKRFWCFRRNKSLSKWTYLLFTIVPKVEYGDVARVLSIGDEIRCAVSEIKPDGKISLTMKIRKRIERKHQIKQVKKDIANLSDENTSLRSIWMVLTNIQHYMLKIYAVGNSA